MSAARTRLAIGLISLAVIALELALMRSLSLRFWHHLAYMVISVALLGFGASGTVLTLLRRHVTAHRRTWLAGSAAAFTVSVPASALLARCVDLDVQFLAWDLGQLGNIALLELVMFLPFFLAACVVGLALMDEPGRIAGHYAASLVGSGLGAVAAVAAMYVLSTGELLVAISLVAFVAAATMLPWTSRRGQIAAVCTAAATALLWLWAPREPDISIYKTLPQLEMMTGIEVIHRTEGPLGRIDVVAGDAIHHAPALSLQYTGDIPPHVLLITDGDQASAVYDCGRKRDWAFLDHTTAAAAYRLSERPRVLILGAGGGADIGLAIYHDSREVIALEMNRRIIQAMTGPLAARGGDLYRAPGVTVLPREARGYLASDGPAFDVIQLPPLDAFGASGAGVHATQESYLYTVECFRAALARLGERGVLCITRWARTPPRDGLRVFDTAAQALRREGLAPDGRLAMIRNWATVTVLASKTPLRDRDTTALRRFCDARSFDLCCLPDMTAEEANRRHVLARPYYFEGATELLGPRRQEYLDSYLFNVEAATDDRPYFFHSFRRRAQEVIAEQLGRRSRAFLELGYVMLLATLVQAVVGALLLILLPLAPGIAALKAGRRRLVTMAYFLLLGVGFMLLEMGLLAKLILYLAHPVYSAAAVIASFLVFAGLGSMLSGRLRSSPGRTAAVAGGVVVTLVIVYVHAADHWLSATQSAAMGVRFLMVAGTIAPLAMAMGHMFPSGLRALGKHSPLVPWAWGVNGFASVVATVAAPVLAMHIGFSCLILLAAGCYLLAGLLVRWVRP